MEEWLAALRRDAAGEDVSARAGAAGADSQAWRGRAAARDPDDSGPGGADRRQAGPGADLRGGLRRTVPTAIDRGGARRTRCGQVHEALCDGYTDVVDADLSKYFDTIPHAELMQSRGPPRRWTGTMLRLLKMWLKMPVEERDERGGRRMSGGKAEHAGHAARAASSRPLLANIYMNRFLRFWRERGTRPAVPGAGHQLCRRLRDPRAARGRGAGVDAVGDDAPGADAQRAQDVPPNAPRRVVRLPGLHVRARSLSADGPDVSWPPSRPKKSVQRLKASCARSSDRGTGALG